MSDNGTMGPHQGDDGAIRTMLGHWRDDARFAVLSSDTDVFLVLDGAATRILHASDSARRLVRAVSDSEANLLPALRIDSQIGPFRLPLDRPTLARVRLDPRGVAIPATCTVVRSALPNGETVLILALPDAPPAKRSTVPGGNGPEPVIVATAGPARADALPPSSADDRASVSGGTAPQRFIWRSDAAGVLIQVSGPAGGALRDTMIARSWRALSESGALVDAEGLLAALDQRRTFRAIPVTLIRGEGGGPIELDVSGAPLDRAGAGFGGFGMVRPASGLPVDREAVAPAPQPEAVAVPDASSPVEPATTAWDASRNETEAWVEDAALDTARPQADTHLSSNEHDAFREIARALGARFAGDAEKPDAAAHETTHACAVMPFPLQPPRPVEPVVGDPDATVVATLERLPAGVLVYRGDTILFANRPLLALAGFDDFASLAAGGVGRLFRGLAPHERTAADVPAILSTRDGTSLSVDIERSAIAWASAPAELLLARDASPGDALRQHAAAAIAQDFAGRRGTDALGALDVIDDGIAILDGNGRVLSLNRGAATILDLDPREVVGASVLSLFASESTVDLLAILHGVPRLVGTAPNEASEVAVRTRSGDRRLLIRVSPLSGSEEPRLCAVIRDVTATRGTDSDTPEAGRVVDAQKADFLAKVGHEIRAPIGDILGLTDVMLAEASGVGGERHRGYLGNIRAAGSHVLELVDDLLELARIEAGRLDLKVTELPLNTIVSRCVELFQPQAARDRIVIRTSFSDDLATLMADEPSVRQATLNVIANAIAFTEAGGQVIVSTTMADRGEIALRVRDTGIGMTPDEVEAALQPFRQPSVVGARKGTGLGLPLTKALVEANHGRFRISSRKNEGTLVEMLFPADAAVRSA